MKKKKFLKVGTEVTLIRKGPSIPLGYEGKNAVIDFVDDEDCYLPYSIDFRDYKRHWWVAEDQIQVVEIGLWTKIKTWWKGVRHGV
jgi:hypothetical protein